MKHVHLVLAAGVCLVVSSVALAEGWRGEAQSGRSGAPAAPEPRSEQLISILDEHVEFLKRTSPVTASTRGDLRFNDLLGDESPAAYAARREEMRGRLERLRALNRDGWTEEDHLDADLLEYDLSRKLAGARFHREQLP